jgi:ABC-type amino acid transport substrate-binding protein
MLLVWMLAGMVMVAYVTSTITSTMTVEKLKASHISGVADLSGRPVGTLAGTSIVPYLRGLGIDPHEYPGLKEAVDDLISERILAMVYDAPILQYFDHSRPDLPLTEVGPIFDPQNYGIALPIGSPLRQPLNRALLQLMESGMMVDMAKRYFGTVYQP